MPLNNAQCVRHACCVPALESILVQRLICRLVLDTERAAVVKIEFVDWRVFDIQPRNCIRSLALLVRS